LVGGGWGPIFRERRRSFEKNPDDGHGAGREERGKIWGKKMPGLKHSLANDCRKKKKKNPEKKETAFRRIRGDTSGQPTRVTEHKTF